MIETNDLPNYNLNGMRWKGVHYCIGQVVCNQQQNSVDWRLLFHSLQSIRLQIREDTAHWISLLGNINLNEFHFEDKLGIVDFESPKM